MKLVRDKIPSIIEESGRQCAFHTATLEEYKAYLHKKMVEELEEFVENPSYEEAADMYEVFIAMCKLHKLNIMKVELAAIDKKKEKGAFKDRIILERVDPE